jgi:hypothetical protein
VSLDGFRVFGFVGARGVIFLINGTLSLIAPAKRSAYADTALMVWPPSCCTSHPFGHSQTIGTRENRAHPVLKYRVPHGFQPRPGWAPDPRWAGGWCKADPRWASHPGVLCSIPKREEPGKTGRQPVLKYRVLHGSQCVIGRRVHTGLGSSSLAAHVLHYPPPPTRTAL